jgi:hypothetical protein
MTPTRPAGLALALALAAGSLIAQAQPPKAVITGPKRAALGDLVILDASQSTGTAYLWRLVNSDKTYLPVDANLRVVFSSGTPGDFIFALIAAGTNANGGPAADISTHTLTVAGPAPGPGPTPPPNPTPLPPATTPTGVVILYENDDLTPEQARLLNTARNDPLMRRQVYTLDKDAETEDETPLPLAVAARKHAGNRPLPVVIALYSDDSFGPVADLPATPADLLALLKAWRIPTP